MIKDRAYSRGGTPRALRWATYLPGVSRGHSSPAGPHSGSPRSGVPRSCATRDPHSRATTAGDHHDLPRSPRIFGHGHPPNHPNVTGDTWAYTMSRKTGGTLVTFTGRAVCATAT